MIAERQHLFMCAANAAGQVAQSAWRLFDILQLIDPVKVTTLEAIANDMK